MSHKKELLSSLWVVSHRIYPSPLLQLRSELLPQLGTGPSVGKASDARIILCRWGF